MITGRRTLAISIAACLMLAVGCACIAADFSADLYSGSKTLTKMGKIYVTGKMIRVDMTTQGKTRSTIVRLDKKVVWMIDPSLKQYMEMPIKDLAMADPRNDAMLSKNATKKKLGTEKVSGYVCEKTAYVSKQTPRGMATRWYSKKLDWPLKTVVSTPDRQSHSSEMRNIKVGKQPSTLFSVPKGYKKMTAPQPGQRGKPGVTPKRAPGK